MRQSLVMAAIITSLFVSATNAQSPSRRQRTAASKALHKAWLKEKLDLDTSAAAGGYDVTIKISSKSMPERWVALARLEELARIGVLTPEPNSRPSQMPQPVRKALTKLQEPIPYKGVLANPDKDIKLKPLRPATPLVLEWAASQVEPMDRRRRQRMRVSAEMLWRWHSWDILRVELEGNRNQAARLRSLYFANWRPPKFNDTPDAVLAKANERLSAWIKEEQSSRRRTTLRDFQKGLQKEAKKGAANAVAFLQRLPLYGERVLSGKPAKPVENK